MTTPANTTLAAVRLYGLEISGSPQVLFTDAVTGAFICKQSPTSISSPSASSNSLNWAIGQQGAFSCGPSYVCFDFKSQLPAEYAFYCLSPTSVSCLTWKEQTCLGDPTNEYWPVGDPDVFQGCLRSGDRDPGGCTCCKLDDLFGGNELLTSSQIRVTFSSGSAKVGQIRFYAFTDTALPIPTDLNTYLKTRLGSTTECQDARFFNEYLEPDGNYFFPLDINQNNQQNTVLRTVANSKCIVNGGYLATTFNTIDQSDIISLKNFCSRFAGVNSCWINARDNRYYDSLIPRSDIIDTSGCLNCTQIQCTVCYDQNLFNGIIPISFSTYPGNPLGILSGTNTSFTESTFPSQINGDNILKDFNDELPVNEASYGTENFIFPRTTQNCQIIFNFYHVLFNTLQTATIIYVAGDMNDFMSYKKVINPTNYVLKGVEAFPARCAIIQFFLHVEGNRFCTGVSDNLKSTADGTAPIYTIGLNPATWTNRVCPGCSVWDRFNLPETDDLLGNTKTAMDNNGLIASSPLAYCVRSLPTDVVGPNVQYYYRYSFRGQTTRKQTSGTYGIDWLPGLSSFPFLPVFIRVGQNFRFSAVWYSEFEGFTPSVYLDFTTPIYWVKNPFVNTNQFIEELWVTLPSLRRCVTCPKVLDKNLQWDQRRYQTNVWVNSFNEDVVEEIYIYTRGSASQANPLILDTNLPKIYHQITFIESISNTNASPQRSSIYNSSTAIIWKINSCAIVTPEGFRLSICDEVSRNYICAYDYTKYTVVPGTQCPPCGTSIRSGGAPLPGITCFDELPLANSTLFPIQHEIKRQYLAGTLDIYVDDFNLPEDTAEFGNTSIIWGFKDAWLKWKADFSNREGQNTRGVNPVLNFCDLSLTGNFPIDCGTQRNPTTNVIERWCASNEEFCNLEFNILDNTPMRTEKIPPIYQPSDITIAVSDPSCGFVDMLRSYAEFDKFGNAQDDLTLYVTILELTAAYVNLQIISSTPKWFNAGKTPYDYIFEANYTSSVSGQYLLQNCDNCINPIMQQCIHPLNIQYILPAESICVNVSLSKNSLTNYITNYEVTVVDTGSYYVNGLQFPLRTFKGISFTFYNLDIRSNIYLYNPIITNEQTITECTTRQTPLYVEPKSRILSSAALRKCILTRADQELFPGKNMGNVVAI